MSSGASILNTTGYECLTGGGEMGLYMRSVDWSKTILGPVSGWPQSLRTSVSICLNSKFPILICWGPDLAMLYNDGYREIIAAKHPAALAHPLAECWVEIWHIIGPMLEGVFQRADATWSSNSRLILERSGYPEECYFTFSFSPIRDESGGVGGIFTPVAETTEHVIGERRLRTLRDLADRAGAARDVTAACMAIAKTLGENPYCIPFAALYLFDKDEDTATLAGSCGVEPDSRVAPERVTVNSMPTPLRDAVRSSRMSAIENLPELLGPLPSGAWDTPVRSGVILPILMPGEDSPIGFVLAGVNPRKRLDVAFRAFFELIGGHISSAVADARAYQDERQRSQALAEIDRAKTVFFSNVSHEFRTPLTLMLGPLETMIEQARPTATVNRAELELVRRNGMRLLRLVNTLLDFSRIEAGRIEAQYQPTDLFALTAELASAFRSAMNSAGLEFTIDCPPLPQVAYVDRDMWEKIVLNLLSNALKFTLAGGVTVRLRSPGDRFELSVEDTGTGIPDHEVARVFNRFHRVEGASGRTHEGSGIGLALVQELAKLHGGTVRVESAVGKGSTFIVSIPKGHAHLPAERVGLSQSLSAVVHDNSAIASACLDEATHWPPAFKPLSDSVAASNMASGAECILLADDNADMRGYVRRLLGDHYEVRVASNGLEALAAVRRHHPDLVLTDLMMPGLDGLGLLRELRAGEDTRTIPVILLSAQAGEDARVEGLRAGADDYIVKPFTARELVARVSAHLSLSRLRREAAERERALRTEAEAAHQRTTTILESISDAFFALDPDWRFTYVNAAAEQITGLTRGELLGRSLWEIFPATRGTNVETQYRRAIAERVPIGFENYYAPWRKWLELRVYPAKDGGLSIFCQEITERKQAEQAIRKTNEALRAANADLEQFAHSASHDLREPLRMITTYCQLLSRTYTEKMDSQAHEIMAYCIEGAHRMESLLNDLLAYVHASSEPVESVQIVSLEPALDEALTSLRGAIEETGATVTRDPMPALRIAPVHAQQLFLNLIGNALKYHGPAPPIVHVGARKEGDVWILSVEDNGIGIAPEYRERIFKMFQRLHTRSEYSGSGMGLAICRRIVGRYEGRIRVESELGKGSTFIVSLPQVRSEAETTS